MEDRVAKAHDILAELRQLGAVVPPAARKLTIEEVTVESGGPSVALRDERGARTVTLLNQLSDQLRAVSEASDAAAATVQELAEVWADEDLEVEEKRTRLPALVRPKDVAAAVTEAEEVRSAPEVAPSVKAPPPENIDQIRDMIRRKVRGDDLSSREIAAAHGELVDDTPDVVPLGTLTFTPSYPKEIP